MLLASSEEGTADSTIQMIIISFRNLPKAERERERTTHTHAGGKKRWPGWFTCLTDLTVNKKLKLRGREKRVCEVNRTKEVTKDKKKEKKKALVSPWRK